ncbi:MAG: glycosyltransferase family 4 protein, partial [Chitinophagaceae bacterium]
KCHVITFGVPQSTVPSDKAVAAKLIREKHQIPENDVIILFNGLLSYHPNTEGVRAIVEKINPILLKETSLNYKIVICGRGLPESFHQLTKYAHENIVYAGFVENIELYFKAADIFINPVITGGGIKTKLVEALSFNTTVISTVSGALGFDKLTVGNKLTTIKDEDWVTFANAIREKIIEPLNTPTSFYDYYYWGNITQKALQIIERKA